jgi:tRNA threonylcarbamoyladenosine modification (KEOPS) complex  Pcc1 subunit
MSRKEEVALLKILGARMREGRKLSKFSANYAAAMLNHNHDHLIQIERCQDVNYIPFSLIKNASNLYDVSIDFLFGANDDWERCNETKSARMIHSYIHQQQLEYFSKVGVEIVKQKKQLEVLANAVSELTTAVNSIDEALIIFEELNPEFDELKAGAMLLNRVKSAGKAAATAVLKLKRVHVSIYPKQSTVEV